MSVTMAVPEVLILVTTAAPVPPSTWAGSLVAARVVEVFPAPQPATPDSKSKFVASASLSGAVKKTRPIPTAKAP